MAETEDTAVEENNRVEDVHLPPLGRDRAFWALTATQFLGAFNDNLFKQLVLLICVDRAIDQVGDRYQGLAIALFAVPFVLFSGFGGFLSDRYSKRRIIVYCKVAEIVVMGLGLLALKSTLMWPLMSVLFCMSLQSALFGPPKYGILPELFRESDLPRVNGAVQMTTFLAIIFGWALAGYAKQQFQEEVWMVSLLCVGIATLGTLTSLFIRQTPVAHPHLEYRASSWFINRETRQLLFKDRSLLTVIGITSLFWFLGGVVQPAVNQLGKVQYDIGDSRTSILGACIGIGIALGCLGAGFASHRRVDFRLSRFGALGIVLSLAVVSLIATQQTASITVIEWETRLALLVLGVMSGLFVVPLQVFIQARPPEQHKGRMIGAMNLINWIGIFLSAIYYQFTVSLCDKWSIGVNWIFASLVVLILPVALFYQPPRHVHDEVE